jgi:hypothetical protein
MLLHVNQNPELVNITEIIPTEKKTTLFINRYMASGGGASGYRVDGPWTESRWGFLYPSRPALRPNGYQVLFPGVQQSPLTAEIKE